MATGIAASGAGRGVTPSAGASAATQRSGGLGTELAKSESELADWTYCPSSKTPEGKHKIELITQHIDQIKARIEHAEKAAELAAPVAAPAAPSRYVTSGVYLDLTA